MYIIVSEGHAVDPIFYSYPLSTQVSTRNGKWSQGNLWVGHAKVKLLRLASDSNAQTVP